MTFVSNSHVAFFGDSLTNMLLYDQIYAKPKTFPSALAAGYFVLNAK